MLLLSLLLIACIAWEGFGFLGARTFRGYSPSSVSILKKDELIRSRSSTFINNRENTHRLYGIPKLFRWLVDLYPTITQSVDAGLLSGSNPMAIDNFYLDMNGIIHTCTHSNNDELVTLSEKEMFKRIFAYTDRLYKLVKPSRLMYLAIDGVAPRAKMNQQRSRRFRSAKEREALLLDFVSREGKMPEIESFDSNCITPGNDFMFRLSLAFKHWIKYKIENDPFWRQGAKVVFSGPDVPGEGEHKIMDMIRKEKANDPNYKQGEYKHCMYGLDADLIMLSLVTHEPHFILLRETINARRQKSRDVMTYTTEDFELLEVSLLRQMLKANFASLEKIFLNKTSSRKEGKKEEKTGFVYNLDRLIDDFVFMCFFVGNDFLPCLPHMDIADGSLNLMMNVYKDILPELGGYLTNKADIHLSRVELFIQEIARREPLYFEQRAIEERDSQYADTQGYKDHYYKVKFGIDREKGKGEEEEEDLKYNGEIRSIIKSYMEGLAWVLAYYHNGCSSWSWYFPHLYAPLATDMKNLSDISLKFEQGTPFTPLLQLLSVLPPQSSNFLPPAYTMLMVDVSSPLADIYPLDFSVDLNGKKRAYESIVQIPFIDETRLLDTVCKIDHTELTEVERLRNIQGEEISILPQGALSPEMAKKESMKAAKSWSNAASALTGEGDRPSRRRANNF